MDIIKKRIQRDRMINELMHYGRFRTEDYRREFGPRSFYRLVQELNRTYFIRIEKEYDSQYHAICNEDRRTLMATIQRMLKPSCSPHESLAMVLEGARCDTDDRLDEVLIKKHPSRNTPEIARRIAAAALDKRKITFDADRRYEGFLPFWIVYDGYGSSIKGLDGDAVISIPFSSILSLHSCELKITKAEQKRRERIRSLWERTAA